MGFKEKVKQNMHWNDSNWVVRWLSTAGFVVLIIIFRLAKTGFDANEVFTLEWLGSILPFLFAFVFLSKLWSSAGVTDGFDDPNVKKVRDDNDGHYLEINKNHRKSFDNFVHNDNYEFRAKKRLREVTRKINYYGNKKPSVFKLHIGKKRRTKIREKYSSLKSVYKQEKEQILLFMDYLESHNPEILRSLRKDDFDIELYTRSKKEVEPEEYFMNEGKYNNEQGRFRLKSFLFRETIGTKLITTIAVPILISFEISRGGLSGDAITDLIVQLMFLFMGLNGAYKTGIKGIVVHLVNQIKEDNVKLHTFREEMKEVETLKAINLKATVEEKTDAYIQPILKMKRDLTKEEKERFDKFFNKKGDSEMTKEEKQIVDDYCNDCKAYGINCAGLDKEQLDTGLILCEDKEVDPSD